MWQYEVEGNGIVAVLDYSAPNARPALKLPEIPRESVVSLKARFDLFHESCMPSTLPDCSGMSPSFPWIRATVRDPEYFVMVITLSWRDMRHDLKDTHQIVLELAAKVFRILFAFAV